MPVRAANIFILTLYFIAFVVSLAGHAQAQFLTSYQPQEKPAVPYTQPEPSVEVYALPEDMSRKQASQNTQATTPNPEPYYAERSAYGGGEQLNVAATKSHESPVRTDLEPVKNEYQEKIEGEQKQSQQLPVDFTADSLVHDDEAQIITAKGNVVLIQGERSVRADQIRYFMNRDVIVAKGHVIVLDENGDTHTAEEAELNNAMKEGFILGIKSYLAQGGQLTADRAERKAEKIVMTNAAYTPCDCEKNEDGKPTWQIRADELTYHEAENRVSYKNAKFEIFGVPVLWTPFLSHPDGQVKRKSGFLSPTVGYDSELGITFQEEYYWDIAPNKDATIGTLLTTQEAPVAIGQYRHRFENASFVVDGSLTYSGRTDDVAGSDVYQDDETRGHLFSEGRWDINNKWRAGTNLELTTDDQYLRQYDFSSENVLENEIYVERFSGRNYTVGRALAFQDVRVQEERVDQPNVLPEIITSFVGEPNQTLGGRWKVDVSALGLQRDGSGQDMSRFVVETNWQRRLESEYGLLTTVDLNLRGDAYYTNDHDDGGTAFTNTTSNGTDTRGLVQAHVVSSYPLVKELEGAQVVAEPIVALTVAPSISAQTGYFPNEDSQDVQIDASNVFNADRFPGKDRIEDESRVTYGMKTGYYTHTGSFINAFVGQSYNFDQNDDNPFPVGSGLSDQHSDVVGQFSGMYNRRYGFNYRYQIDSEQLASQRHEFDGYAHWDKLSLNGRYLYAKALSGTDISESREQLDLWTGYYLTPKWRVRGRSLYDLGDDPGLRKAGLGLDYYGCCMSFSFNAERTLTTDSSGDSGTDITFRVGLKNIGEFETSKNERAETTSN